MGNLGFLEMGAIAVIGLLVFGPERLPELARTAARLIARFRAEASRSIADLKEAADIQDLDVELRSIRQELAGVRDEVTKAVQEPAAQLRGLQKEVTGGGPTGEVPAVTAGPPPMDPEAT